MKDFVPDQYHRDGDQAGRHQEIGTDGVRQSDVARHHRASLDEGDELIGAGITNGENYIFLGSHEGQAIRFAESQVRPMGRQARGVRAMDLAEGDYLVGMEVVEKEGLILSIAENGYGKRTPLEDYRLTNRGGKGVINMKTTNKTGNVVAILSVREEDPIW